MLKGEILIFQVWLQIAFTSIVSCQILGLTTSFIKSYYDMCEWF
jgi:hypothetical protein